MYKRQGPVLAEAFAGYFKDQRHVERFRKLLKELEIPKEVAEQSEQIFAGINFVITGSVTHFANRGEIKELIESLGGKVTGSCLLYTSQERTGCVSCKYGAGKTAEFIFLV